MVCCTGKLYLTGCALMLCLPRLRRNVGVCKDTPREANPEDIIRIDGGFTGIAGIYM